MKRLVLSALLLAAAGPFLGAEPLRSEVRIFCEDPSQLSDLLSELDICAFGTTEDGGNYLVAFVDHQQLTQLRARGLELEVTWEDIRDKFQAMTGCQPDDARLRDFGYFFTYWEMRDTLYRLCANFPEIARLDSSMRSFQNKALYCLKLSDNPGVEEGEPQLFFNGATHAREPLGTHVVIAFASLLCANYGRDSLVTWLVNNREIYFVPVMNPDGYVYNSDSGGPSAYWRKNRNPTPPRTLGIDLNRNYGYKWGYDDIGSSPNPSSETYRGPERWSEPEAAAIRDFLAAHRFRAQMDFHTYGRYNMYPWAYVGNAPPEQLLLQEIVDTFRVNNSYPNTGQWYHVLYASNGASVDYEFSDTAGKFVTYAFSCELGINDFWYGWDNPPYVDAEVALNIPNCYYLTRLGGVYLAPIALIVNDTTTGNGNGQLDPGESADLWFRLQNRALHTIDTAKSVTARLLTSDTLVEVLTPMVSFPDIPRRTAADNRFSRFLVRCHPAVAPGETVALRLEVTYLDDGVAIMQPLTYQTVIGRTPVGISVPQFTTVPVFTAYPNPACGRVIFTGADFAHGDRISIYTADGRLVRQLSSVCWDRCDNRGEVLPAGVYFAYRTGREPGTVLRLVIAD